MAHGELDREYANYNLTVIPPTVLTYTMTRSTTVQAMIYVGDDANPISAAVAGIWDIGLSVLRSGSTIRNYYEPYPAEIRTGTAIRKTFITRLVAAEQWDTIYVEVGSPNAGDINVHVHAVLFDITIALPPNLPAVSGGFLTRGTGVGQINPDGTGQVPSSNAALATVCTEARLARLDAAVSAAVAAAAAALTAYDPPTNAELTAVQAALTVLIDALNDLSAAAAADAVWDEAVAGHVAAGSAGLKLASSGAHIDVDFRNISVRGD